MPGQRKFRLSARKNYEKKKRALRKQLIVRIPREKVMFRSTDVMREGLLISIPRSIYLDASVPNLVTLKQRMTVPVNLFPTWSIELLVENQQDLLHMQSEHPNGTLDFTLRSDFHWSLRINEVIAHLPTAVSVIQSVSQLDSFLKCIQDFRICVGNPDEKFDCVRELRKGIFKDTTGRKTVAFYDERNIFSTIPSTIRHSECWVLSQSDRCQKCEEFRPNLNSLLSRTKKRLRDNSASIAATDLSSHVNYKFLSTPEKIVKMRSMRKENKALSLRMSRMRKKIEAAVENSSSTTCLDRDTSDDLQQIIQDEDDFVSSKYPEDSFPHIFWKTQRENISKDGKLKNGVRWHPLMIKWCLYLKHQSSKAYETLRQSGLSLPSQRTLRDYSNAVKAGAGFSLEVDRQILDAAKLSTSPNYHRLVILLIDEMHVKEDLVYNKHSGRLVGFVDLGEVNNHLAAFERSLDCEDDDANHFTGPPLAKSVVAFMVRGLFTKLRFPYAQFPCTNLSGEQMFFPFWECVARLERMGFKVLAATFDGASVNRRLVSIHDTSKQLLYKVRNMYADEDRQLYFFSDPPHLIKTVRNCWSSKNRCLWNNGRNILWQHLRDLYQKDHGKGTGLSLVPKLKYEHCFLTSFSKMRVDLAAQVLSESVASALEITGGDDVKETANFARMFNTFFDMLNVSNFYNYKKARNPAQQPYSNPDDERLRWLEDQFLKYLSDWEMSVQSRPGKYSAAQRKRMMISTETLLGIRMTVKSFVEFVPFLLSLPEVKEQKLSFLSQNLCQDPIENFFGCQRQIGGTSDNPNVSQFFSNTQSLRVVDSFCRGPVRGNCRGTGKQISVQERGSYCSPLLRRRKTKPS